MLSETASLASESESSLMTPIFSYGSNGTAQLRARCLAPALKSRGAIAFGWTRIFCGISHNWDNGGYASLVKVHGSNHDGTDLVPSAFSSPDFNFSDLSTSSSKPFVLGSITMLNPEQLSRLSQYETGYNLVPIEAVDAQTGEHVAAQVFICRDHTFHAPPSQAYCVAIHAHLREHFSADQLNIDICKWDDDAKRVITLLDSPWIHPGLPASSSTPQSQCSLTLPALMVELNNHPDRRSAPWIMPRTMVQICKHLKEQHCIDSISSLAEFLQCDENYSRLDQRFFDDNIVSLLQRILFPRLSENESPPPSTPSRSIVSQSPIFNPEQPYLFVYGSLHEGQRNHSVFQQLCGEQPVRIGSAFQTCQSYRLLSRADLLYPFMIDSEEHRVHRVVGEVFQLPSPACLAPLDEFEGEEYTRVLIDCQDTRTGQVIQAYCYTASDPTLIEVLLDRLIVSCSSSSSSPTTQGHVVDVPSGDWVSFVKQNSSIAQLSHPVDVSRS